MNEKFTAQMTFEDQFFHALLDASKATMMRMDRALEEVGLSGPKLHVLWLLVQADEPIGISYLAQCMKSVKSNATQIVDRLESDELVRRIPNPQDRRSVLVELTKVGQNRFEEGDAIRRSVAKEIISVLSETEQQQIIDLMRKIARAP